MVVADEHIAVHLVAEVAVVLHSAHRVEVTGAGGVGVVHEVLLAPLIAETALYVEILDDVPSDAAAELVAVAVNDRLLAVEHPVRVAVLLLLRVGPVLDVAAA